MLTKVNHLVVFILLKLQFLYQLQTTVVLQLACNFYYLDKKMKEVKYMSGILTNSVGKSSLTRT